MGGNKERKKTEAVWRREQERETEREVLVQTRSKKPVSFASFSVCFSKFPTARFHSHNQFPVLTL